MTEREPLDFADPAETIRLLDELVGLGMTIDQFRRLHHLPASENLSIGGHRSYARKILRGATRRFSGEDKNVGTARRLARCLEGLRAKLSWDDAIALGASGSAVIGVERVAIREMLLRIPIERAQRAFYKSLLESSANRFRQSEMEKKLGFNSRSFQSSLNALSKRINETPSFSELRPGYRFVFDVADEEDDRSFIASQAPSAAEENVESDPVAYELVQRRLRRHQSAFRDSLMRAYEGRCAISGTNVPAVLEAAHIEPHVERGDNTAANGLLLRADLHALFDEGLLRVHPRTLEVHLDSSIDDPSYAAFNGQRLRSRADKVQLSVAALEARWQVQSSR